MKRFGILILFSIAAYLLGVLVHVIFHFIFLDGVKFTTHFGRLSFLEFFQLIPDLLFFGAIGWFLTNIIKGSSYRDALILSLFILVVSLLLSETEFFVDPHWIDIFWAYIDYLAPSAFLLIGFLSRAYWEQHYKQTCH